MANSGPKTETPGWTSPAEEIQRTAAYEAELLNRYRTGQFLSETDKREARKLIAQQAVQS